ncbi:MAG TPA: sialidase family protein [Lacipirellulaceae bacterium]|nr:sialidase family protein [Lacipirellulaceae bacterium]
MHSLFRPNWRVFVQFAIVGCAITCGRAAAAKTQEVVVFKSGDDGYHTYRIPVIVRVKNGDLLAFAEGRKNGPGDHGDIDIVLKRSGDAGKTWGNLQLAQDEWADPTANVWIGNPTPVVDLLDSKHPGRIWLVFTRSNQRMFVASSDDGGHTWSKPTDITATAGNSDWIWYAAGPVHAIQLMRGNHAGRLVIPCDHRGPEKDSWGVHLVYSDDHGVSWKLGAVDTRKVSDALHPNECVAAELADGRVYVNARNQNGSNPATRMIAFSSDGGETFDAPFVADPQIASPVVQNSLVRLTATDQGSNQNMLIYAGAGNAKQRRDLTILTSMDETKTWGEKTLLHAGPAAYCDLVKLSNKSFGVLFEAGNKLYDEILFSVVLLDDLSPDKN